MTGDGEVKEGDGSRRRAPVGRGRSALDVVARAQSLQQLPASLGSRVSLELGLKPLLREMHDTDRAEEAAQRWRSTGLHASLGPEVQEHIATAAAAIDPTKTPFSVRPLHTHPAVERAVEWGGTWARRVLLEDGPVHRWLKDYLGADQYPERMQTSASQREQGIRRRRVLYVSADAELLERGRQVDAMGEGAEDAHALGALLGYPSCCTEAFAALPVRYPNRKPIAAAMARTRRFEPLLNNLCLRRFAFIAHFPCRYDCPASLQIAERLYDALWDANPALLEHVVAALGQPRVYASDAQQAVLIGAHRSGHQLHYQRLVSLEESWPRRASGGPGGVDDLADSDRWGPHLSLDGGTLRLDRAAKVGEPLVVPFGAP